MAKSTTRFVCQSCGAVYGKWAGKCDACDTWNSLVEEAGDSGPAASPATARLTRGNRKLLDLVPLEGETAEAPRMVTGIAEFDRVCGGGLVAGSALLVGGDPGIGKSTILLQAMAALGKTGKRALYISGEEAIAQVRMRAKRLGLEKSPVELAAATSLADIVATLEQAPAADAVVIDSIQTMWSDALESAPGTVAQVRACAQALVRVAKARGTAVILVGHVTKEGQIAGPRVVEHMVDTVLYFEGERGHQFRILRAVKNRFGPTDEIGVFEMRDTGLSEVSNPSALFLGDRSGSAAGSVVFAGIEGTRPVLMEIQALVVRTTLGTPRRAVVGWDGGRLSMVLAVLEARCGASFGGYDVYLNVAGGLRVNEPAADLAVAAALLSSLDDTPIDPHTVVFGEISLSGAIRPVNQAENRAKEAAKLGFRAAIGPGGLKAFSGGLAVQEIETIGGLVNAVCHSKVPGEVR
ncbi:DNA repair protein RadA [Pyruvatibacter sp.]|uniref:DNA repair protein RadA n=1 Tax=Pyruvatibacter sp. TaxID=1981328 RepID=UPI0032EF7542